MTLLTQLKKWIWYGFYVIALTGILLAVRFPADDLAVFLEGFVSRKSPTTILSISGLTLAYPLGVRLKHVEVDQKILLGKMNLLTADDLILKAEPISLMRGKYVIHLTSDLYGGDVTGGVAVNTTKAGSILAELHLSNIRAEQVKLLEAIAGVNLNCGLNGDIFYEGDATALLAGTGKADFAFGAGTFSLVKPLFGFTETVGIEKMSLGFSLRKRQVETKLIFTGSELLAELSGDINLVDNVLQSTLDLKGKITGTATFLRKDDPASGPGMELLKKRLQEGDISFMLLGTVAEPRVRLR